MQAKFVQAGARVDYSPSVAKSPGDVVVQGSLVGVTVAPIEANAVGTLAIEGVFDFPKVSGAIAAGAGLYWDADGNPVGGTAGTGAVTTTSSGNTFLGWSLEAAAELAASVRGKLLGAPAVTANHYGPLNNPIADPGNAGAIPVTASGYVPLVTAGSETRTLAAPAFVGQELLIYIKTDGGTCVITVASAVNQTGNNTLTLADVNDSIRLVAVESGSSKVWRVVCNDGVALSTV